MRLFPIPIYLPFFYPNNNTKFRNCFVLLNEFIKTEWLMGTGNVSKASKNYDVFWKKCYIKQIVLSPKEKFHSFTSRWVVKSMKFFFCISYSFTGRVYSYIKNYLLYYVSLYILFLTQLFIIVLYNLEIYENLYLYFFFRIVT